MAENPRTTPGVVAAMTIAGSDPSGGAGIQADLKTFAAMRVYGAAAITSLTVQNTEGVKHSEAIDPQFVADQIDIVAGDIDIKAAKTGMLPSSAIVQAVAKAIERQNLFPLVVDPVMIAKSGDELIDDGAVQVIVRKLLPLAAVVTPNRHEAIKLLGDSSGQINDVFSASEAAKMICRKLGAAACVVTGIHRPNDHEGDAVDVYCNGKEIIELSSAWRSTPNTHGSGCTFSAAIVGALAKGQPIDEAVQTAKNVVSEAIRQGTNLGGGRSPVNHLAYLDVKA